MALIIRKRVKKLNLNKIMRLIFIFFFKVFLIHFLILTFITLFTLVNMENDGIIEFIRSIIKNITEIPIDHSGKIDKKIWYLFLNLNVFIWINCSYLLYLLIKRVLMNKIIKDKKSKLIYNFIIISSIIILSRQIFVLFYGKEPFELVGNTFSSFILFLYIIYVEIIESYLIPIYNLFHLNRNKKELGNHHKTLIILNIVFLIRALIYLYLYLSGYF